MYILRKYFSNKKVKPHTKEWYDGAETDNQRKNRKKAAASLGTIAGLGVGGIGKLVTNEDAVRQGEAAEIKAAAEAALGAEKLKDLEQRVNKSLQGSKGMFLSEDLLNLQRNSIAKEMGIKNPEKLLQEIEEKYKNVKSGKIRDEAAALVRKKGAKKFIPAAAIIGTGVGLGINSAMKSNHEKSNRVRREKLQKNYSKSDSKDAAIIGSGVAAGAATGIGAAKLLENTGSNLAAKVSSFKKRQELKKEVKKIEKGVETQIKKVKDLGLKGKDLENAISDIKKRSGGRITTMKLINGQEIQNIEKGAKLGFKNGKFMRNAKIAIPIGTAIATIPVTSKLVKNANKKKER